MKYRLKWQRGWEVRFVSHLDLLRTWERSLRRAGLPLALTEGFNPHPKLAFAHALAVGMTSEGEYLDLELREYLLPAEVQERLNQALPRGFQVVKIRTLPEGAPALMSIVNRADYLLGLPLREAVADVNEQLQALLTKPALPLLKRSKSGEREVDFRPLLYRLAGSSDGPMVHLRCLVAAGSEANVRPEDIVKLLEKYLSWPVVEHGLLMHRLDLLVARGGELYSPMEIVHKG